MLLAFLGYSGILVASSNALPILTPYRSTGVAAPNPRLSRRLCPQSKRDSSNKENILERWVPDGVSGHIDLMTSTPSNSSIARQPYDPYTTIQSIPNPAYKIAEMGYNRAVIASNLVQDNSYLLNAKPFGWGTKFWMLKSQDVDCYAGSEFASSYNASSQIGPTGGAEYPVTLRSPLGNNKQDGIFAYCATYDPNPRGSGMTLGAAPCGRISCAPLPPPGQPGLLNEETGGPEDPASFSPSVSRNPDGTFAPTFFTTRPCNYLDSNCHVSQIFLFNAMTGTVRPMYHTQGMNGANGTRITSGQPSLQSRNTEPAPLWKDVEMVFRQGDLRALQGWPDPDPTLVVADPAFDQESVPQSSVSMPGSSTSSGGLETWNRTGCSSYGAASMGSATAAGPPSASASANSISAVSSSTPGTLTAASSPRVTPSLAVLPVWIVPPPRSRGRDLEP
jgi:hypothetical protein